MSDLKIVKVSNGTKSSTGSMIINVGASSANSITLHVQNITEKQKFIPVINHYPDTFHITNKYNRITITRTDVNTGWGQNLVLINHDIDQIFKQCGKIEPNIHISWKSEDVVNSNFDIIKHGIRRMKELNPKYKFIISNDAEVDAYIKSKISNDDYQLIKYKHIVEKIDLWRLLKIYHEGGIYLDIDRFVNRPLKDIIRGDVKCILPTWQDNDFSQDIMISGPNNKIHKRAIQLNLERRRQGGWPLSHLGPNTYFHAVTEILCGIQIDKEPPITVLNHLRNIINNCKYLDTYREEPYFNTILYQGKPINVDKQELYNHYKVNHWAQSGNT